MQSSETKKKRKQGNKILEEKRVFMVDKNKIFIRG